MKRYKERGQLSVAIINHYFKTRKKYLKDAVFFNLSRTHYFVELISNTN